MEAGKASLSLLKLGILELEIWKLEIWNLSILLNRAVDLPTERSLTMRVSIAYYTAVILESKLCGELITCVADSLSIR